MLKIYFMFAIWHTKFAKFSSDSWIFASNFKNASLHTKGVFGNILAVFKICGCFCSMSAFLGKKLPLGLAVIESTVFGRVSLESFRNEDAVVEGTRKCGTLLCWINFISSNNCCISLLLVSNCSWICRISETKYLYSRIVCHIYLCIYLSLLQVQWAHFHHCI